MFNCCLSKISTEKKFQFNGSIELIQCRDPDRKRIFIIAAVVVVASWLAFTQSAFISLLFSLSLEHLCMCIGVVFVDLAFGCAE